MSVIEKVPTGIVGLSVLCFCVGVVPLRMRCEMNSGWRKTMAKYIIEMECPYSDLKVIHAIADLCNGTMLCCHTDGDTTEVLDRHDQKLATIKVVRKIKCSACDGKGCWNNGGMADKCPACDGRCEVEV